MHDPILHLLGLAKKAGKLEIGEEPVGGAARARHARVIFMASDAASNSSRRAAHFGETGNVLFLQLPHTKAELGMQLGRSSVAMLAVTDPGFAGAIGDRLALLDPERYGPAAAQLRTKADRYEQRQKEQRQHEKNLRKGKYKPWAAPAAKQKQAAAEPDSSERRMEPRRPDASHIRRKSGAPHRPEGPRDSKPYQSRRPAGGKSGPDARREAGDERKTPSTPRSFKGKQYGGGKPGRPSGASGDKPWRTTGGKPGRPTSSSGDKPQRSTRTGSKSHTPSRPSAPRGRLSVKRTSKGSGPTDQP